MKHPTYIIEHLVQLLGVHDELGIADHIIDRIHLGEVRERRRRSGEFSITPCKGVKALMQRASPTLALPAESVSSRNAEQWNQEGTRTTALGFLHSHSMSPIILDLFHALGPICHALGTSLNRLKGYGIMRLWSWGAIK